MIERRIGRKLAVRIDPEGIVHEAYLRARLRWTEFQRKPFDLDTWIYGQVRDRLIEVIRIAMGPEHDVGRDVRWPDDTAAPWAECLIDSLTGPSGALSRAERCEAVRVALNQLDATDREILALRYFEGLNFAQIGAILGLTQNAATKRALRDGGAARPHSRRLPARRGESAVRKTPVDPESSLPPALEQFEQDWLQAPNPADVLADYCRRFPEFTEEFRKLSEAMAILRAAEHPRGVPGSGRRAAPPHPRRFGPYRVVGLIEHGGMGEVYEAVEEPLGRRVAIKTIRRDVSRSNLLQRFDRERRVLARLHHTNVVPIYATGSEGDLLYFAMPYLIGASLSQVIRTARSHEWSGKTLSSSDPGGPGSQGPLADPVPPGRFRRPRCDGSRRDGEATPTPDNRLRAQPVQVSRSYIRSAVQVMSTVAEGLHHAHEAGVIHRDLKPSNIIVETNGHAWTEIGVASLLTARPK